MPTIRTLGVSVTSFFCAAVKRGAIILNWAIPHPWPFLGILALTIAFVVVAARRTTWRPPDPVPLRKRRAGGQILRAASRLYWSARAPSSASVSSLFR